MFLMMKGLRAKLPLFQINTIGQNHHLASDSKEAPDQVERDLLFVAA